MFPNVTGKPIMFMSQDKAVSLLIPENIRAWAAISITTKYGEWPNLPEDRRSDLLQLWFDDWDKQDEEKTRRLFDEMMAGQILQWVQVVWPRIDMLVVHCQAGFSRSPAVAAVLARIFHGDDAEYFKKAYPNRHVYRVLLNEAMKMGLYKMD